VKEEKPNNLTATDALKMQREAWGNVYNPRFTTGALPDLGPDRDYNDTWKKALEQDWTLDKEHKEFVRKPSHYTISDHVLDLRNRAERCGVKLSVEVGWYDPDKGCDLYDLTFHRYDDIEECTIRDVAPNKEAIDAAYRKGMKLMELPGDDFTTPLTTGYQAPMMYRPKVIPDYDNHWMIKADLTTS
jgi:hypothetical protein